MIWNGFDMSKSHMDNDTLRRCRSAADALIAQSASEDPESGDGAVHVAARKADSLQKCSGSLVCIDDGKRTSRLYGGRLAFALYHPPTFYLMMRSCYPKEGYFCS